MKGHAATTLEGHKQAIDGLRQVVQGRLAGGPFEDDPPRIDSADTAVILRMKQAITRDRKYSSAGSVYLRAFGLHQAFREIYEGGKPYVSQPSGGGGPA